MRVRADIEDAVVFDPEVDDLVDGLRRVDDSAVGDAEGGHGEHSTADERGGDEPLSGRIVSFQAPHRRQAGRRGWAIVVTAVFRVRIRNRSMRGANRVSSMVEHQTGNLAVAG